MNHMVNGRVVFILLVSVVATSCSDYGIHTSSWRAKGVDPKKYEEMLRSFSVQNKINRARKMSTDYKIQATPTLAVNGRYLVEQVAGAERLFSNIEQLIADARAANKPVAAVATPTAPGTPAKKK